MSFVARDGADEELTLPFAKQKNNAAVWRDTQGIMKDWFGSLTAQQDAEASSLDEDTVATTLRLTLVSDWPLCSLFASQQPS